LPEHVIINKVLISSQDKLFCYDTDKWIEVENKEDSYIEKGMNPESISDIPEEAWANLLEPAICYYTDDDNVNEITIETETEPFTIYDEMGDSMEVLYYTDDPDVQSASLEVIANYSPLDELEDEFEIVTWSDKDEDNLSLELKGNPHAQLIMQESDIHLISNIESFSMEGEGVQVLLSKDSGKSWQSYKDGIWMDVNESIEEAKEYGMTLEELNSLSIQELNNYLDESSTLRFAYYLNNKYIDDVSYIKNIHIATEEVASTTPSIQEIKIDYDELTIEGRLKELEELNAINLNKLNFKANTIMNSKKYNLHDLVIDTLEDTSNIESATSVYSQATKKYQQKGNVILNKEEVSVSPESLYVSVEGTDDLSISYRLNNSSDWMSIEKDKVINLDKKDIKSIQIQITLPISSSSLEAIAYGWI